MESNQLDLFRDVPIEPKQLELLEYPPPPPPPGQIEMFSGKKFKTKRRDELLMNVEELKAWKTRIISYQQKVRHQPPATQTTLFDLPPEEYCDPDTVDPLSLQLQSMSFYRIPSDFPGQACLYFVMDSAIDLILYVGETLYSNRRWKGVHDCKQYIGSYQDLNYRYHQKTAINITFWWDTPSNTKKRQQMKQKLIQKWRSPFNKEMWLIWGQPFG